MEKKTDALAKLRNKLPVDVRDCFVQKVDPVVADMLRDEDLAFRARVQDYVADRVSASAVRLGYDRFCAIPRYGSPSEVLLVRDVRRPPMSP